MGRIIMSLGEPGTGKSRAIKNLDPKTTVIIKPNNKDFPWRGAAKDYVVSKNVFTIKTFTGVQSLLAKINIPGGAIKTIILEDLTHYFNKRVMDDNSKSGFGKWGEMAVDVFKAIIDVETELRADLNLIIIAHTTSSINSSGEPYVGMYTPGKMLDDKVKIPSYFSYILHTRVSTEGDEVKYEFITNYDGYHLARSPEDCLPMYMPNDYKEVIDRITAYQKGEDYVVPVAA